MSIMTVSHSQFLGSTKTVSFYSGILFGKHFELVFQICIYVCVLKYLPQNLSPEIWEHHMRVSREDTGTKMR
jgi:hypothetical protein